MRILLILSLVVSCFMEDSSGKGAGQRSNMSNDEILMEDLKNYILNDNIPKVKAFLAQHSNIINNKISQNRNIYPIYFTVSTEMLELLIDNGADISKVYTRGNKHYIPHLVYLILEPYFTVKALNIIQMLLEKGADVNEFSDSGYLLTNRITVFSMFIKAFHSSIVVERAYILEDNQEAYCNIMKKMIDNYKFENESVDNYKESALFYALKHYKFFNRGMNEERNDRMYELLKVEESSATDEQKEKVKEINNKRKTDFREIVLEILKKTKKDIVNKMMYYNKTEDTALSLLVAMYSNDKEQFTSILETFKQLQNDLVVDGKGNTILHYAVEEENMNILNILLEDNRDIIDKINKEYKSPLDIIRNKMNGYIDDNGNVTDEQNYNLYKQLHDKCFEIMADEDFKKLQQLYSDKEEERNS